MSQQFIGVDVGTSLIKAAVYDLEGRSIAMASAKVPVLYPHEGYAEQDMAAVWEGVADCLSELMKEPGVERESLAALSCAGQGDGLWTVDAENRPAGHAILWCDNRAAAQVQSWMDRGLDEPFFENSGITLWPGCAAAILAWLKENDPKHYGAIDAWFCCKDWVNLKLTGRRATDLSDGTIPFMDVHSSAISRSQIEMLGLDGWIYEKAPEILQSFDRIGTVSREAAERTGLPEGLPVITGMIDVSANAIAAGAVHSGQTFTIIGTTLLNAVLLDNPVVEPKNIGFMVTSPLPGQWTRVLGSLSGTPNLDWFLREFYNSVEAEDMKELYDRVSVEVKEVAPGAEKVLYLPFIHGERSPFVNPHATAGFLGIRENTNRAVLARALYEGVALATKHNLVSIGKKIDEIVVTGGGSNDPVWCQVYADVTGARIRVPSRSELGTLGAAVMAARGVDAIEEFRFEGSGEEDRVYIPDPESRSFYDGLYELYVATIGIMEKYWRMRHEQYK